MWIAGVVLLVGLGFGMEVEAWSPMTEVAVNGAEGKSARRENRPNKDAFPSFREGDGPMGYGQPDKVLTQVATWKHPVKAALATLNGARLMRVEFYKNGTYPVFFVKLEKDSTTLRYLYLHETNIMDRYAKRIYDANAGWAFEVVDDPKEGDRFRSHGPLVRKMEGLGRFLMAEWGSDFDE